MGEQGERVNVNTEKIKSQGERAKYTPCFDLREHLNRRRQQNVDKKGPPPDPKYNYLSDPSRDNEKTTDNQNYISGNDYENYNMRRGRGYSTGFYRGRSFRAPTRSRGRGRGYNNWQQNSYQNDFNYQRPHQENVQRTRYRSKSESRKDTIDKTNFKSHHEQKDNTKEQTNEQINDVEKGDYEDPPNTNNFYKRPQSRPYYAPQSNSRGSEKYHQRGYPHRGRVRSSRGSRRPYGRYNFKKAAPVNIKVEFNSTTGEHKYTIEKMSNANKQYRVNKPNDPEIIDDGENWEEEFDKDAASTSQKKDNTKETVKEKEDPKENLNNVDKSSDK